VACGFTVEVKTLQEVIDLTADQDEGIGTSVLCFQGIDGRRYAAYIKSISLKLKTAVHIEILVPGKALY
jgi:hypothetical protein